MHWGVRRKASVVLGIRDGLITREQACRNYMLSIEELTSWEADFAKYGTPGLLMKTLKGRRLVRPPHAAVGDVGEPSQGGVGTKRAR